MKKLPMLMALVASAVPAAAQDLDAMVKWTSATVVHYRVVGEFAGEAPLFLINSLNGNSYRKAVITDRVEFEVDWNQAEFNLAGKPVIRNFPTRVERVLERPACPASKIDGALEHLTLVTVRTDATLSPGIVTLETKRDQPAGSIPSPGDTGVPCGTTWDKMPARSDTDSMKIQLPPGMMLVMPGGLKLTADKKSFVIKDEDTGWTWTITPSIVK